MKILLYILPAPALAASLFISGGQIERYDTRPDCPPSQGATRIDFDETSEAGRVIHQRLDADWNGHTVQGSNVYYQGVLVEFPAAKAPEPDVYPNGIEAPVVVLQDDDGKGWGVVVDSGDLLTYQDHASPRPSPEVLRQRIVDAKQARRDLRTDTRTVRTNMIANIDTLKATAPLTNGFSAAQNRLLVNDVRRELIDTQQEVKALAEVVRQMLKDATE
jgi:hypothetical protein